MAPSQLAAARYVSLRTFKRSGAQVDTPVWAAPLNDALYIFSAGDAGKVKRLRNSNRAQIATCDYRGGLSSSWHEATAELVDDPAEIRQAQDAFRNKYGWQILLTDLGARLTGRFDKRAYIRVTPASG